MHKDTVVACVRISEGRTARREVRTFGTVTRELLLLADWLAEQDVSHVLMEATGVYWKPLWHVLESGWTLVLANAAHVKGVPGRKTDVKDAEWLADLLAHGLVRGSLVPPTEIQDLRDLTRTRRRLVQERTAHVQRIQKTLQDANIKIDSVISDVLGMSGRAFLEAIIDGETNPEVLAKHASPRLKATREQIEDALRGYPTPHHRFMLNLHLGIIANFDTAIAAIGTEVAALLVPFRALVEHLRTIPGVSQTMAEVLIAETGGDMAKFPNADHLVSWAGLCARNDVSAGKHRTNHLKPGAAWLRSALVQCAWAAARKKHSRFEALFYRVRARGGAKKAVVAVAAEMLRCAWHVMSKSLPYAELTLAAPDPKRREREKLRLVKKLRSLGYNAEITEAAAVA